MAKEKIKLDDVVTGYAALQNFSNAGRLGWDLTWEIDDLTEALEKHFKRYNDEKMEFLKAWGDPSEDARGNPTGRYNIRKEHKEEYDDAMEKLGNTEVTVEFEPLDFDKLDKSGVGVFGAEMRGLKKHFISRKKEGKVKQLDPDAQAKKQAEVKEKVANS